MIDFQLMFAFNEFTLLEQDFAGRHPSDNPVCEFYFSFDN